MFPDGNLSLDIADYYYFFSSVNFEPSWADQIFSSREDGRMYMYTLPHPSPSFHL